MLGAVITTEEYKKKVERQKPNQQLKQRTKEKEKKHQSHKNQKMAFKQTLQQMKKFPVDGSDRQGGSYY